MHCPLYYVYIIEQNRHNLYPYEAFILIREANEAGKGDKECWNWDCNFKESVREGPTEEVTSEHGFEDRELTT